MTHLYKTLALMLTHRCNAACDICCLSCAPDNEAHLSPVIAERVIREAAAMPGFESVHISGGEAWLYREEVLSHIRLAHSLGLSTMLYTNGFWGRDGETARQSVEAMKQAGLEGVRFSADRYHQAYVPGEHLSRAMEAVLEAGLQCELSVMEFADVDTEVWLQKTLPERLRRSPVKVIRYPATPAGRAREKVSDDSFSRKISPALLPGCGFMGILQLDPRGDWYPCCGMSSNDLPVFRLGNIEDIPLCEVESRVLADDFLRIILLEGWGWIWYKARELGQPLPKRVTMFCECCSFFFSHPELMSALAEEAHLHAGKLQLNG